MIPPSLHDFDCPAALSCPTRHAGKAPTDLLPSPPRFAAPLNPQNPTENERNPSFSNLLHLPCLSSTHVLRPGTQSLRHPATFVGLTEGLVCCILGLESPLYTTDSLLRRVRRTRERAQLRGARGCAPRRNARPLLRVAGDPHPGANLRRSSRTSGVGSSFFGPSPTANPVGVGEGHPVLFSVPFSAFQGSRSFERGL